jgi:hypothetical protein
MVARERGEFRQKKTKTEQLGLGFCEQSAGGLVYG